MNVRFLILAQQEIDEAVIWFNEHGKGMDFLDELDRIVRLVNPYPFAATEIEQAWESICFIFIDIWRLTIELSSLSL